MADTTALRQRRFSVDEYHRMVEKEIFPPEERVELVHGLVREMSPKNRAHVIAVNLISDMFREALRGRARVYKEDPLRLRALDSEPEPDVMVCSNPDIRSYGTDETRTLLAVEVAESSLHYDLGDKAKLYAEAGIPEYWVVNLIDRQLVVFTLPLDGSYQQRTTLDRSARVVPQSWADLAIDVASLFPDEGAK